MPKVLYIPARVRNAGIKELMSLVSINESYAIVTTVQFLDEVKELEKEGYTVLGQILGCNIAKAINKTESYLYIGTGLFHPLNLAYRTKKPVYILNPETKEFFLLPHSYRQRHEQKKKAALLKFYSSQKIGIIISTKSGQNNTQRAHAFRKKMHERYPEKKFFLFLCDNLRQMEDFNDIECWVNTACIRIVEDELPVTMLNIRDLDGTAEREESLINKQGF